MQHDVIIAADGIKSAIRSKMMARRGEVDETIPTGEAAYRASSTSSHLSEPSRRASADVHVLAGVILQRSQMESDPELKQLIDNPTAIRWVGASQLFLSLRHPSATRG